MEYLMTYGWAILIIAVVLGALFQLGVFNSSSFSPRAPPGACQVFRPSGPGTVTNINLMGVCTGQLPQYVAKFNGASSSAATGYVLTPTQSGTISFWLMASQMLANAPYVSLFNSGYSSRIQVYAASGLGKVEVYWPGTTPWPYIGDGTISAGQWAFVSVTWVNAGSGSANGEIMIYVNGAKQVDTASLTLPISASAFSFNMGFSPSGPIYYNGSLANAQLYNASLTANQIQALYLEGMGGAPMKLQNLIGWWPLNGNSNDYSGNNNNGVPTAVTFTSQYGK